MGSNETIISTHFLSSDLLMSLCSGRGYNTRKGRLEYLHVVALKWKSNFSLVMIKYIYIFIYSV